LDLSLRDKSSIYTKTAENGFLEWFAMWFSSSLKRFREDISGNYAIIFAVSLVPLLAAVGTSVDYAGAMQTKTRLHDSNDAAAFFAATSYRKKGTLPNQSEVLDFVASNFASAPGEPEPTIIEMKVDGGKLYLTSRVVRPLAIMQVLGQEDFVINTQSVVNVGDDEDLEIALVLDTTESMRADSGSSTTDLDPDGTHYLTYDNNVSRMSALKFAAMRFTDTIFENDGGQNRTRIAVVPFANYVNVGTDKRGASWLNVPNDTAATGQTCHLEKKIISTYDCEQTSYVRDGATIPTTQCKHEYAPEEEVCYATGESVWRGCVGSRDEPLNLRDASPSTQFQGLMNVWCTTPMKSLSSVKTEVLSTISNLWDPYHSTYIPEGVMWGMRVLSSQAPFTEVKASTQFKKVRKIMVLMTDGDNQAVANVPDAPTHRGLNPSDSDYSEKRNKTDSWTLRACTEAKNADIEVFTISFGTDISTQARSIVKSCATDAKHYFDAKDAAALNAAFQAIAATVTGMFLAG
jgi:Flp pilus assembly protein TadG